MWRQLFRGFVLHVGQIALPKRDVWTGFWMPVDGVGVFNQNCFLLPLFPFGSRWSLLVTGCRWSCKRVFHECIWNQWRTVDWNHSRLAQKHLQWIVRKELCILKADLTLGIWCDLIVMFVFSCHSCTPGGPLGWCFALAVAHVDGRPVLSINLIRFVALHLYHLYHHFDPFRSFCTRSRHPCAEVATGFECQPCQASSCQVWLTLWVSCTTSAVYLV